MPEKTPDSEETSTAAMSTVELVKIRKALDDNGYSSGFLRRHPSTAFAMAVAIVSCVLGSIEWYASTNVVNALEARDTSDYRSATTGDIKAVQTDVATFKTEAKKAHRALADGIKDVGELQLQQATDQRGLLEDLAESQRVNVQPKQPELEAAEAAVRAGPQLDAEPESKQE